MTSLQRAKIRNAADEVTCPFCDSRKDTCAASVTSMVIVPHTRQLYCSNENFDNCPVFLARILRGGVLL
jgi:uncharacterized Zn-finger protein